MWHGENALYFANQGHNVVGIDFLEDPVKIAKQKATERGLAATFFNDGRTQTRRVP